MTRSVVDQDHIDAARVAEEAGTLLLALRESIGGSLTPEEGKAEGDRQSHEFIDAEMKRLYPDDGLLSEEGKDSTDRLDRERVWIIDPLDGTREFGEPPRDDWAVHVALVVNGDPVVGAVALPAQGTVLSTANPPVLPPRLAGMRLVVSRSRPPAAVVEVAEQLGAELVPMGSAGAKAMAVVLGKADAYYHAGGQYEWDSAAPVGVAKSAGLHVSRADGSPLVYNNENPWMPDLLICRAELAEPLLAAIAKVEH